jgi:hypothetical protein
MPSSAAKSHRKKRKAPETPSKPAKKRPPRSSTKGPVFFLEVASHDLVTSLYQFGKLPVVAQASNTAEDYLQAKLGLGVRNGTTAT